MPAGDITNGAVTRIGISIPETFSDGDFKTWLRRYELCCDANGWDEQTRAKKLPTLLSGRNKLGLLETEVVRVVLDEDGTEVDEEDYFTFLPNNATVLILRPSEKWRPQGAEEVPRDEVDTMDGGLGMSERVKQLVTGLQRDVSRIITFSNEDLQQIVDISVEELASLLQDTESYAKALQDSCCRHLEERQQASEAIDLLRLYHKARQHSPYVEGDGGKKRKVDSNE